MRPTAALLLTLAACAGGAVETASSPPAAAASAETSDAGLPGRFVASLQRDANLIEPAVSAPFARRFLGATRTLPSIAPRTVYRTPDRGRWFASRAEAPRDVEPTLVEVVVDEEQYYEAELSAPLHYARPLDLLAARGLALDVGSRVVDFGYGSIGHLRLLASLGLEATGVDVRPQLPVFYSRAGDTGRLGSGSIRLLNGRFPLEVRPGPGNDLFVAKNTLKKGYIHPDRPAPASSLIDLGVDDATFLRAVHDALRSSGWVLVYNLFVPIPDDQPWKPMSDGRSPFPRAAWEAAGFEVLAFDEDDTEGMQRLLRAERPADEGRRSIRVLYTMARRRD